MQARLRYGALFSRDERTSDSFWTSLRYFNYYRIVVAALFLIVTVFYSDTFSLGSHALNLFRYTSLVYLVLGIMFHGVLRHLRDRFNLQLSLHVLVDIVAITVLTYASGGVRSGLGIMVLISLTGAALLAPRRLTFLYAAVGAIALLFEQAYWVLGFDEPIANFLQPGLLSIGFFATAGITNWLAHRLAANESLARQRGRELQNQMRVSELVIQDMQDGVLVVDRRGHVVQYNPQAQRLLGVVSVRGAHVTGLLPGIAECWRDWQDDREAGSAVVEVELHGKGLHVRLIDTGTDEEFSVLFLEDTTRSREQARQLKLAALGRLTANIGHEIRNPISAISHAVELLDEERRERDRERLTRIIRDNTRRLDRLVADVLQLNRRDRVVATRFELGGWLMQFVEEFVMTEAVPAERFEIEIEGGRETLVRFDRDHLRQVLWNLLRNAVHHARVEPRSVRIVLRTYGDRVELNVLDNGPGVAAGDRANLFEPFFTTNSKGTGLGLYLARELCAANAAVLEYISDLPGGHFRIVCQEAGI